MCVYSGTHKQQPFFVGAFSFLFGVGDFRIVLVGFGPGAVDDYEMVFLGRFVFYWVVVLVSIGLIE